MGIPCVGGLVCVLKVKPEGSTTRMPLYYITMCYGNRKEA